MTKEQLRDQIASIIASNLYVGHEPIVTATVIMDLLEKLATESKPERTSTPHDPR